MSDLSPEGRALLKAARDDFEASAEDCSRIDRALTARLGLAAGAIAGATTATSVRAAAAGANGATVAGASGMTAALVVKCVAAVLLVGAAGVGAGSIYRASRRDLAPPPPMLVAEVPPRVPITVAKVAASPVPSPGAVRSPSPSEPYLTQPILVPIVRSPATGAHTRSSLPVTPEPSAAGLGSPDATLGAETQLMRPADQALRTGDPARALELLDEHERRFPQGVLAEERSAERVTALCGLGRVDEAHAEAARFIATHADSPLVSSVRRSCGGEELGNRPRVP
jgi:hypothetical protein